MLKIVKWSLWFLPFVAREMQGRWKGEERDSLSLVTLVTRGCVSLG